MLPPPPLLPVRDGYGDDVEVTDRHYGAARDGVGAAPVTDASATDSPRSHVSRSSVTGFRARERATRVANARSSSGTQGALALLRQHVFTHER
jgi:hypothetical protein